MLLFLLPLAQDVGVYEEPSVEASSLERHQTGTHDSEGQQYNFVEQAARERQASSGKATSLADLLAGGGEVKTVSLADLLAGGGGSEVEVVDMESGPAKGLHEMIQKLFSSSPGVAAKPKAKPSKLPSVPPDTPLADVLSSIRQTMHSAEVIGGDAAGRRGRAAEAEAGEGGGGGSDHEYIDHLDARGPDLLEADLLAQLQRVRNNQQAARAEQPVRRPPQEPCCTQGPCCTHATAPAAHS